ncbi:hypothetical protein GCM10027286_22260 [Virgibacillus ainsalahensis]
MTTPPPRSVTLHPDDNHNYNRTSMKEELLTGDYFHIKIGCTKRGTAYHTSSTNLIY